MLHKKAGNLTGFTMLELAVTIGLVVLLLTLSSISYRRATKRTEIILAAQQVASTLRLAESYAASAREFNGVSEDNIWGLYFSKAAGQNKKVIMFVDKNKDGQYSGEGEKHKEIILPRQVSLLNIYYKVGVADYQEAAGNELSITFVPPDPKVRMCQTGCNYDWAADTGTWSEPWSTTRVTLSDELNDSVKNVYVNFFGMIDVR